MLRRTWRSRATPIALAGALWLGALTLDPRDSAAGGLARLPTACLARANTRGPIRVALWFDDNGIARCEGWWRQAPTDFRARGIFFHPRHEAIALWAPIIERRSFQFRIIPQGPPLTPTEHSALHAAMFDSFNADDRLGPLPAGFRAGNIVTSEFKWTGVAGNLYALVCVGALAAWVIGRLREGARAHRYAEWVRLGQCGHCGYEVQGPPGGVCPECGKSWDACE